MLVFINHYKEVEIQNPSVIIAKQIILKMKMELSK